MKHTLKFVSDSTVSNTMYFYLTTYWGLLVRYVWRRVLWEITHKGWQGSQTTYVDRYLHNAVLVCQSIDFFTLSNVIWLEICALNLSEDFVNKFGLVLMNQISIRNVLTHIPNLQNSSNVSYVITGKLL